MGHITIIGLTGGIGAGKSTASAYLKKKGFAVIDADAIARRIVEPGKPLVKTLAEAFGAHILKEDESLDRRALAAVVFQDREKKKRLDSIMHGAIIAIIDQQIAEYQKGSYPGILIDAPLLFETNLDQKCDRTWLITAKLETRIARVCMRDHMSQKEVEERIKSQMDDAEKKKRADVILDNSGSRQELEKKLDQILKEEGCK